MKLHASSWTCMQAYGSAISYIDLHAFGNILVYSAYILEHSWTFCMHFWTFWNILEYSGTFFMHSETFCIYSGTFWNILHAFLNILEKSETFCKLSGTFWKNLEYSACLLKHSACILEPPGSKKWKLPFVNNNNINEIHTPMICYHWNISDFGCFVNTSMLGEKNMFCTAGARYKNHAEWRQQV